MRQQSERLALLVDHDSVDRSSVRRLLTDRGLDLVNARTGFAALELMVRLPETFRLVIVSLDLPGLSGGAVLETLRRFRPGIPLLCLSNGKSAPAVASGVCSPKPIDEDHLGAQMDAVLGGTGGFLPSIEVAAEAIARAEALYAISGNLVEAALEVERGIPGPGW